MKKISFAILFLPLVFQSCKKEENETFAQKLKGKDEVIVLTPEDYPKDLVSSLEGEIYIQVQSNQRDVVYKSEDPIYNFNGSIQTTNTVTIDISTPTASQTYNLTTTGAASGYKVYNTLSTGTNPTYLAGYFSKNVTVQVNNGVSTSPTLVALDIPKPILITAPASDPAVAGSDEITTEAVFEWDADATNRNGVIVRLQNIPTSGAPTVTMLLTPDDGQLAVADITSYLPSSGRFEIEISRLNYDIITDGTKQYRVIGATTSIGRYNLTN